MLIVLKTAFINTTNNKVTTSQDMTNKKVIPKTAAAEAITTGIVMTDMTTAVFCSRSMASCIIGTSQYVEEESSN